MTSRRLLTLGPAHEPLWVRLYTHQIGEKWAAMIVDDGVPPPEPGSITGQAFFADNAEEAEQAAKACLGLSEPVNCKDRTFLPSRSLPSPPSQRIR